MIFSAVHPCRFSTTGPLLLAAGMLLAAGGAAQAQLNPQELLKQVLPGASQDSDDSAASGERACQRYAEKQGLEVRKISDTSRSGSNNLEVLLSVEDRDDRYDARCIYDTKDEEVREFEPVHASTGDQDGEVSERLAQRAQEACEELALDRDLDDVDFDEARARGDETVEIDLRARVERRPVNRELAPGDAAFQERTIEAVERGEEAVVSKTARVTEEIGIRKDVEHETEMVRDTVRKQEVEVEDDRRPRKPTGTGTVVEDSVVDPDLAGTSR